MKIIKIITLTLFLISFNSNTIAAESACSNMNSDTIWNSLKKMKCKKTNKEYKLPNLKKLNPFKKKDKSE